MENKFKVGDKVRINIDELRENGITAKNAKEIFSYIEEHANEEYAVKKISDTSLAPIYLDHPTLGNTTFFEEELILVKPEEGKSKKDVLREKIIALMSADDSRENYEKIAETVFEAINSDDESYSHIGYHLLKAYLDNDADAMLTAISGWCVESILIRAKLIPDDQGLILDEENE